LRRVPGAPVPAQRAGTYRRWVGTRSADGSSLAAARSVPD